MPTVMYTDYRESGAANLLSYMRKEAGQGLHNRYGEEMSDGEMQAFIDKSDRHQFERSIIISPENGDDLTDAEFSLSTRQTMREFTADRPTADYCYAVHRDTDNPHVHVALTGDKSDLYMTETHIESVRERAHTNYVEQHPEQTPIVTPEHDSEYSHDQENDTDRDGGSSR